MKILESIVVVILAVLAIEAHADSFDMCKRLGEVALKSPEIVVAADTQFDPEQTVILTESGYELLASVPDWFQEQPWDLAIVSKTCDTAFLAPKACVDGPIVKSAFCIEKDTQGPQGWFSADIGAVGMRAGNIATAGANFIYLQQRETRPHITDAVPGTTGLARQLQQEKGLSRSQAEEVAESILKGASK